VRFQLSRRRLNLKNAFNFIDTDGDDFIRCKELRDFLASNGFYATDRELAGLLCRFDPDNRSRICLEHFIKELSPVLIN